MTKVGTTMTKGGTNCFGWRSSGNVDGFYNAVDNFGSIVSTSIDVVVDGNSSFQRQLKGLQRQVYNRGAIVVVGNSDGDRRNSSDVDDVILNGVANGSDGSDNSDDNLEGGRRR